MVKELKARGIFYQSLLKADEAAAMAREMAMREYIYLSSEQDVPRLGESQDF